MAKKTTETNSVVKNTKASKLDEKSRKEVMKTSPSLKKVDAKKVEKTTPKDTKKSDPKIDSSKPLSKKTRDASIPVSEFALTPKELKTLPKKIKNVLITQPEPVGEKSPYTDLSKRYKLKITFMPLLKVESLTLREFRKNKINIAEYSAVIFNSKNAIDYFFKICDEMRHKMPQEAKYICSSEAIAYYLQKYIRYRKRKVIYSNGTPTDLQNILKKFQANEKFLLPCSAVGIGFLPSFLKQNKFKFSEAVMYRMIPNEGFNEKHLNNDMITFFNPEGVKAFFTLFPDFKQDHIAVGAFGESTQAQLKKQKMDVHAKAPVGEVKSMVMAIDKLFREYPDLLKN
jgi:uroporphyrinogen-III synthase